MRKVSRLLCFTFILSFAITAEGGADYKYPDFHVKIISEGFSDKVNFSDDQEGYSAKWKDYIQSELIKPVNFSGHYRVAISKDGVLLQDCGSKEWVCGWVLDKISGRVVSELPVFNGNSRYFSTIDNGTPSPDLFSTEFYPNSSMMWVSGQNRPKKTKRGGVRCANSIYEFKGGVFIRLDSGRCEIDTGSDMNAEKYLP